MHSFGIIIKKKCSPFNQGIIQQPIMSINKVITAMTELSDPPSYMYVDENVPHRADRTVKVVALELVELGQMDAYRKSVCF